MLVVVTGYLGVYDVVKSVGVPKVKDGMPREREGEGKSQLRFMEGMVKAKEDSFEESSEEGANEVENATPQCTCDW